MLVSEEQYARFDIKEGDRIDDAHFLKIREEMIFDNARRHAFTILSYYVIDFILQICYNIYIKEREVTKYDHYRKTVCKQLYWHDYCP